MSERFAILLMLGALPLFFIGSYPAAFAYLAAFNVVAWSAWAWDRAQIDPKLMLAARDHKPQWTLDQPQAVVLQLTSSSGFPLTVDVREALPASVEAAALPEAPTSVREADFTGAAEVALVALGVGLPGGGDPERLPVPRRREEPEWPEEEPEEGVPTVRLTHPTSLVPQRVELLPHRSVRLTYALTPAVRGSLDLGVLTLRLHGPLGLATRQTTIDVGRTVDVVPALPGAAKLGAVEARPGGGDPGSLSSRKKGSGVELESLREYVAGDEFRKISWKATARRGRTMVKETVQEVSQQVVVLVDVGRRMFIPVGPEGDQTLRMDLAMDACLLVARAGLQQGDRVGIWTFAEAVKTFRKPGRGRKQWMSIGQILQQVQPNQLPTDYMAAANHMLTVVRRRSLVVLITEPPLGQELEAMRRSIAMIGQRHRMLVLCLQDPVLAQGADPSNDRRDTALRRSAAADILAQRRAAVSELTKTGVAVMDILPSELTLQHLQKMLRLTRR